MKRASRASQRLGLDGRSIPIRSVRRRFWSCWPFVRHSCRRRGRRLRLEDMRVVAVRPRQSLEAGKRRRSLRGVGEKVHGVPRQILSDGAIELRESAVVLKTQPKRLHYFAGLQTQGGQFFLETAHGRGFAVSMNSPRMWVQTRAAIQQTELAKI